MLYSYCLLGLLALVTDGMLTYVEEPLEIGRKGSMGRYLTLSNNISANRILPSSYWFWAVKRLVDYL
jgi:hypothetical protein